MEARPRTFAEFMESNAGLRNVRDKIRGMHRHMLGTLVVIMIFKLSLFLYLPTGSLIYKVSLVLSALACLTAIVLLRPLTHFNAIRNRSLLFGSVITETFLACRMGPYQDNYIFHLQVLVCVFALVMLVLNSFFSPEFHAKLTATPDTRPRQESPRG